ncbi:MAG TPA: T9SS type A sorting domain-containing protein [Chitinophagaceae bacterium]|nr:T9SS type A sorting domain-containing protein [Chitinophagaceae bacterium]
MTIVAGIAGSLGFSGDGGQAIKAQLATPQGLAVDMAGNLYVADNFNECIRKVDKNGIITTIAGIKGQSGFSGDGGLATNAHVNYPAAVATDKTGNVYIVDCGNSCIRKIDKNGIITTVAGIGGSSGFSGDGGPANEAQLNLPLGITLDSTGNLFIADNQNSVIRKIDQNGIISTYAGGLPYYSGDGGPAVGSGISLYATFDCISGLALDASGNLYIADMGDKRIREVIKQALPLPLTLISFTGEIEHGRSILTWETADEINTKTFTVERSTDGINFLTLGTVAAIDEPGHHTYNHIDASPLQGNNYYRLKMIDKDGSFSYSNLITINKGNIQFAITVLPNPVTNDVTLQISTPLKGRYAVTITSTGGEPVKHIVGIALVGNNIIHIKTTDLAAGVYIVSYTDGSGLHSTKLVKE